MSNIFSNLRWGILPLDLPRQFWQVLATQAFDALWGVDNHGKK